MGKVYQEVLKNPKRKPKQFPVRLEADLYDKLQTYAERCRRSMNEVLSIMIEEEIALVEKEYGSVENLPYVPDPEGDPKSDKAKKDSNKGTSKKGGGKNTSKGDTKNNKTKESVTKDDSPKKD